MKSENTKKNLHAGHRQRVKANVCKNGFSQLEDHRLLELVLFYSIPQADTNGLAHKLLDELGSLKNIFNADIDRLCMVDGVGESTAIMLSAMGEAHRRSLKSSTDRRKAYKTHDDYRALAVSYLAGESKEVAFAFYFDSADKLKRVVPLSSGDETSVQIDSKKVCQNALLLDATGVVLAHNHPGRSNEPSLSDLDATRSISVMLRKLGIRLYDHIVLDGEDKPYSMYDEQSIRAVFY